MHQGGFVAESPAISKKTYFCEAVVLKLRTLKQKLVNDKRKLALEVQSLKVAPNHQTQFENNYFTSMCSGSEAGSYLAQALKVQ